MIGFSVDPSQGKRFHAFVMNIQICQRVATFCPFPKIRVKKQDGEFSFQIQFIFFVVSWIVQNSVCVIKNVLF